MILSGYVWDWHAVWTGEPRRWLMRGLLTTLEVSAVSCVLATLGGFVLAVLRLSPWRLLAWVGGGIISLFRNTPLLVQLVFWYFAGFGMLPEAWREWLNATHEMSIGSFSFAFPSVEFWVAAWGLSCFGAAFMAEELRAGIRAVPKGQLEAAMSQGFHYVQAMRCVVLPQGLRHAWQPMVGQYLNLFKLSSLAMAIGLGELTCQSRQIESYNFHAMEAYASATLLYLGVGFMISGVLQRRYGWAWLGHHVGVKGGEANRRFPLIHRRPKKGKA